METWFGVHASASRWLRNTLKPERCSWNWGARASRPQFSASRRKHSGARRMHCSVMSAACRTRRRDADGSDRDGRAPPFPTESFRLKGGHQTTATGRRRSIWSAPAERSGDGAFVCAWELPIKSGVSRQVGIATALQSFVRVMRNESGPDLSGPQSKTLPRSRQRGGSRERLGPRQSSGAFRRLGHSRHPAHARDPQVPPLASRDRQPRPSTIPSFP